MEALDRQREADHDLNTSRDPNSRRSGHLTADGEQGRSRAAEYRSQDTRRIGGLAGPLVVVRMSRRHSVSLFPGTVADGLLEHSRDLRGCTLTLADEHAVTTMSRALPALPEQDERDMSDGPAGRLYASPSDVEKDFRVSCAARCPSER